MVLLVFAIADRAFNPWINQFLFNLSILDFSKLQIFFTGERGLHIIDFCTSQPFGLNHVTDFTHSLYSCDNKQIKWIMVFSCLCVSTDWNLLVCFRWHWKIESRPRLADTNMSLFKLHAILDLYFNTVVSLSISQVISVVISACFSVEAFFRYSR